MARKILIAAVLVASAVYFLLAGDPDSGQGLTFGEVGATSESGEAEVVSQTIEADERERATAPGRGASVEVRGTVTSIDSAPVAGARVVVQHPYLASAPALSDAEGRFAIQVEEPRGELEVADERWILLGGELQLYEGALDGYRLIVAASARVSGRVVDAEGAPLAGAEVHATAPLDLLVPFGVVSRPIEHPGQSARTDGEGRFTLASVPRLASLDVRAAHEGFEAAETALADPFPREVVLRLRRLP